MNHAKWRVPGLGDETGPASETFLERLLRVPAVEHGFVDPIYNEAERRAEVSLKNKIGPWVIGIGAGLLFINLYLARVIAVRR